jgi:hypothetical protein
MIDKGGRRGERRPPLFLRNRWFVKSGLYVCVKVILEKQRISLAESRFYRHKVWNGAHSCHSPPCLTIRSRVYYHHIDAAYRHRSEAMPSPFPGAAPIRLLLGDSDMSLDLQQIFTSTYDLLGYDLAIDYACPPEPLLDDQAISMADSLHRTAGLRPA